jgi:hypothetical protein
MVSLASGPHDASVESRRWNSRSHLIVFRTERCGAACRASPSDANCAIALRRLEGQDDQFDLFVLCIARSGGGEKPCQDLEMPPCDGG